MQVAIFNGAGRPITIEEFPEPECGEGQVRIAVARCGICGSDVTMTSGSDFDVPVGKKLGHEVSGEVIEVGRGVSGLKVGDRLACMPMAACGQCKACREGSPLFCVGPLNEGGFGERMVISATSAIVMPPSIGFAEGALVEPMACGRRAMRLARMRKGDTLLVIGAGNMALSIIYWARKLGAGRIAVASRSRKRDEIVRAMGANATVLLSDEDPDAIAQALGGAPDVVAECVGKPGMLALAVDKARRGGAIISMGMCTAPDPVIPALCTYKEVSLHFPVAYSIEDYVETLRSFDGGAVRPGDMISDVIGLTGLPAMIEEMRGPHEHLKVHVAPNMRTESELLA